VQPEVESLVEPQPCALRELSKKPQIP